PAAPRRGPPAREPAGRTRAAGRSGWETSAAATAPARRQKRRRPGPSAPGRHLESTRTSCPLVLREDPAIFPRTPLHHLLDALAPRDAREHVGQDEEVDHFLDRRDAGSRIAVERHDRR